MRRPLLCAIGCNNEVILRSSPFLEDSGLKPCSSLTLSLSRDSEVQSKGFSQRGKGRKSFSFALTGEKADRKMERMQGDGEMNDLECPSPMTDGERDMIQESWAEVYQNCDDVGVVILVRLFVNFPKSQQYFSKFRDIKEREELERNALLRKHARHVMNAIKALVDNLENPDKMTATLEGIAKAHAIKHDVEPVYFKILGGVILEVLGEQTEIVTPEVGAAWTKLMATIYWGVRAIYKEIGWIKPPSSTG